jgi:hypothetical protein
MRYIVTHISKESRINYVRDITEPSGSYMMIMIGSFGTVLSGYFSDNTQLRHSIFINPINKLRV